MIDKKANEYLAELDEECPDEEPAETTETTEPSEETERAQTDKTEPTQETVKDPAPTTGDDEVDSGGNGLAWASIGVGAAFVGGGVAMHLLATQERAPVYDAGGGDPDVTVVPFNDQEAADREQRANTYDTIGLSADIAGGALIGVGIVLLVTNSDETETAGLSITPLRNGAAASYRFNF